MLMRGGAHAKREASTTEFVHGPPGARPRRPPGHACRFQPRSHPGPSPRARASRIHLRTPGAGDRRVARGPVRARPRRAPPRPPAIDFSFLSAHAVRRRRRVERPQRRRPCASCASTSRTPGRRPPSPKFRTSTASSTCPAERGALLPPTDRGRGRSRLARRDDHERLHVRRHRRLLPAPPAREGRRRDGRVERARQRGARFRGSASVAAAERGAHVERRVARASSASLPRGAGACSPERAPVKRSARRPFASDPTAGPSSSSGMLRRDADARRPPAPGRATRPEGQPGRRPTRYQRGLGQEARVALPRWPGPRVDHGGVRPHASRDEGDRVPVLRGATRVHHELSGLAGARSGARVAPHSRTGASSRPTSLSAPIDPRGGGVAPAGITLAG